MKSGVYTPKIIYDIRCKSTVPIFLRIQPKHFGSECRRRWIQGCGGFLLVGEASEDLGINGALIVRAS